MEKLEKISIELDTFKIKLQFNGNKTPLVIHFDTPSRRFYFSVIAFIVNEMKKKGEPGFIHIRTHKKDLISLDRSISEKHASKNVEGMWAKINMAWRHRLPDLEKAALFKILDREIISPYEKDGKYKHDCSEMECDTWANLFSYDVNNKWCLRFGVDLASIGLNDISLSLGELKDDTAWRKFVSQLVLEPEPIINDKKDSQNLWKNVAISLFAILIVCGAAFIFWNLNTQSTSTRLVLELPDKPSIAVMPFINLSEDPKQEFFSDGITEEIITALSSVPKLFVIARTSSFYYKGKTPTVQQIGKELGVRYILEGSFRKVGDRIRVTAKLVDAFDGQHLWSNRYDRSLNDIFTVQDEITKTIITALQVKLTEGEQIRSAAKGTSNLEAYIKYLQGIKYIYEFTIEGNSLGKQLVKQAIALDPKYAVAQNALAISLRMDIWLGTSKSPKESIEKSLGLSNKAIELDPTYADAYSTLAFTFSMVGNHEKAVTTAQHAVFLNPNSALAHKIMGHTLRFAGRSEDAIPEYKKAIRLNPFPPVDYLFGLSAAYCHTGQYQKAIEWSEKAVLKEPDSYLPHLMLTYAYSASGREADARAQYAEVLRIDPSFSIEKFNRGFKSKNKELFVNALRQAGLK